MDRTETLVTTNEPAQVRQLPDNISMESLFGALFDPTVWDDPYHLYEELRNRAAVCQLDESVWVLSSHEAVQHALRSPDCSSDERRSTEMQQLAAESPSEYDGLGSMMLFMDPPDHTRLRRLVARAFTPRQVKTIEPRAAQIVEELLDTIGPRFDVVSELAHPLAVQIICELLGVPFSDRDVFAGWGTALARSVDPGVLRTPEQERAVDEASEAFSEYFVDLIEARRKNPGDELLTELIEAEEDGDRLSMDELVSVCLLVLVAGYETTVNLVGNGAVALMSHRDQWERLGDADVDIMLAVNEFLRYDAPVQMNIRVATTDMDVAGTAVRAGDSLIPLLAAANRDPAVFADPHRLDISRVENPHLAFGGGIHHCLGAALARTEAAAAFAGIRTRYPSLELADAPVRRPTFTLRGFTSVSVTT